MKSNESKTPLIRCGWCDATWTGLGAQHCTACHQTFTSTSAGDTHRKGEYPNRRCDTTGLVWNERRRMWQLPGTWQPDNQAQDGQNA